MGSSGEQAGLRASALAVCVNVLLAVAKIVAGAMGHSYALIADGIESVADVLSSFVVLGGFWVAGRPADEDHPYGHGRAEAIAALIVSGLLLSGVVVIAIQSMREINDPNRLPPAPFTLLVLLAVILVKEWLFRKVLTVGESLESTALQGDAWHHRTDALTSAAAFIGISISLIGGPAFKSADGFAALIACGFIAINGIRFARKAIEDLMDTAVSDKLASVRSCAESVDAVSGVDECRIRKSGIRYLVDIHIQVDGSFSVRHGHEIAHAVKRALMAADSTIQDVLVHIEPAP